jgi:hypothetical protein
MNALLVSATCAFFVICVSLIPSLDSQVCTSYQLDHFKAVQGAELETFGSYGTMPRQTRYQIALPRGLLLVCPSFAGHGTLWPV